MHADTQHPAQFPRIRLVHMLAPVALSIGLVVGGYMVLTDVADEIASTVKPIQSPTAAPAIDVVDTPVAANTVAAN